MRANWDAIMTSVDTDAMTPERSRRLDEAFSDYVAQIACVRPMLYIQTGEDMSLLDNDPPAPDKRVATCRSCEGAMRGRDSRRIFCSACRANTRIYQGAPLIETMYLSAHPKYELNEETEALVAYIGRQRDIAEQSQLVARQLAYQSYTVDTISKQHGGDRNVYFTPESVCDCSWGEELTRCNPRYTESEDGKCRIPPSRVAERHPAVKVGGLGVKLYDAVKEHVIAWLYNLDAMIRAQFAIPLEHRPNDPFVLSVVPQFAELIAKRVVLLEGPHDDPETQLCTRVFEHVAKIQITTCEPHAARRIRTDIRAMRELAALVRDRALPPNPKPVIDFLRSPCPELLRALPTVATDMRFVELCDVLQSTGDCVERKLDHWRELVGERPRRALSLLLPNAIEAAQNWRSSLFVNCLRHDAKGAAHPLPAQGWVDNPHIACWSLVSRATHERRRTGLDPTGLRTVLMSSALMQLNGDGGFFVPGVLHNKIMNMVCNRYEKNATYAYNALSGQLWPYMIGESWRKSRTQLVNWQGSHIEDDVRRAAAPLGGFSVNEIVMQFARSSSSLDQARRDVGIVRLTTDKMIHKPKPQYDQWFTMCVDLLLPILAQLRQSSGIASEVAPSALAEVLRLLRPVREWKPSDGALKVVAGEAANLPEVKSALMRLKAEGSPLVKYTRPARSKVMLWAFDPIELARVLNQ